MKVGHPGGAPPDLASLGMLLAVGRSLGDFPNTAYNVGPRGEKNENMAVELGCTANVSCVVG